MYAYEQRKSPAEEPVIEKSFLCIIEEMEDWESQRASKLFNIRTTTMYEKWGLTRF